MNDLIILKGLALSNYRGLGNTIQKMAPFDRFNFFVGENNAGKSIILNFISEHGQYLDPSPKLLDKSPFLRLSGLDINVNTKQTHPTLGLGCSTEDLLKFTSTPDSSFNQFASHPDFYSTCREVLAPITDSNNWVWVNVQKSSKDTWQPMQQNLRTAVTNISDRTLLRIQKIVKDQYGENHTPAPHNTIERWIERLLVGAKTNITKQPILIPALRKITHEETDTFEHSGTGLINKIFKLQLPDTYGLDTHADFDKINKLLKSVLRNDSVQIHISHKHSISVKIDGKMLPLHALGTGLHEIIIIAVTCTLLEHQIICIEEPELHLHPTLQRRLMQYLLNETTNQYFIATHSASIMDMSNASIFHVSSKKQKNPDGSTADFEETTISRAACSASKSNLVQQLGYQASDILQANFIIWVEGPSDRLYLNHWLNKYLETSEKKIMEGVDYSIMFYGGRLLSHLSADDLTETDDDIAALIDVKKLNRNLAFIIDSDKGTANSAINKTKQNIKSTIESNHGATHKDLCWITAGREIENYISPESTLQALQHVYATTFKERPDQDDFTHPLHFLRNDHVFFKKADKVKIAKYICDQPANLNILDLNERIAELVERIMLARYH